MRESGLRLQQGERERRPKTQPAGPARYMLRVTGGAMDERR